ncbi:MAG: STAS domain-containing protein [Clostridia bacterium]|nr:STAS domain-containing protein [Clostridia bacterium]
MNIRKETEEKALVIYVEGRLDTTTAPKLDEEIASALNGAENLVLDLQGLEYISSAGLRVILATEKKMAKQGKFVVRNANETIMEVFEITGFADILNIEK